MKKNNMEENPDEAYENMFEGFTEEEQKVIQDFMDKFFPIDEKDWTE
jgi:hypothetical protein